MSEMIGQGTNDTIRRLFTYDKERYEPLITAKINCSTNLKAFPKLECNFFSIYCTSICKQSQRLKWHWIFVLMYSVLNLIVSF